MKAKAEPDKPLVYELEVVRLPPWWLLPLKPENRRPRGTFYNDIKYACHHYLGKYIYDQKQNKNSCIGFSTALLGKNT